MKNDDEVKTLLPGTDLYRQACNLRYNVFFKAHCLAYDILFDELESVSEHLALCPRNKIIAYTRLTLHGNNHYQISQMLVNPDFSRQGYGTSLLKYTLHRALKNQPQQIFLYARLASTGFYEKQGFRPAGDEFLSKTTQLAHVKMLYQT